MSNPPRDHAPKVSRRAKRFAIHLPIRYRKLHTSKWFEGRTEGISYPRVLFRGEFLPQPKTTVELRIELPIAIPGEAAAEIVGKGVVARTEESPISGIPPALEVAIDCYRIARCGRLSSAFGDEKSH